MLNIGDKIVYPRQGVGIVSLIEDKEFNGEIQKYYIINIVHNSLKLMLPINMIDYYNLRPLSDEKDLDYILRCMSAFKTNIVSLPHTRASFKKRLKDNTDKIREGTLKNCVEVVCDLTRANKIHPLNTSERELLNNTKKILTDEISLVKHISLSEASELLNNSIN